MITITVFDNTKTRIVARINGAMKEIQSTIDSLLSTNQKFTIEVR